MQQSPGKLIVSVFCGAHGNLFIDYLGKSPGNQQQLLSCPTDAFQSPDNQQQLLSGPTDAFQSENCEKGTHMGNKQCIFIETVHRLTGRLKR